MIIPKRSRGPLLGTLLVLASGLGPVGVAQDTPQSRLQAGLAEEQELLTRKLGRLAGSMQRLAERFEAEGRVHAARLLRDGLSHLESRANAEEQATLQEQMSDSHAKLAAGQVMQSIEAQERVVGDLERLLSILLDRPDLDQLEDTLETLRKLDAQLSGMIQDEEKLAEDTEALREDASNESQRSLEQGIKAALSEQRELLQRNEDEARRSGALDLEKLEEDLTQLLEDQHKDAEVLESWDPAGLPLFEEQLPRLERARASEARAGRLKRAAEALQEAAERTRTGEDAEAALRELEQEAERERRAARASGDPGATRSAEALERATGRLRDAAREEGAQTAASEEVNALAEELKEQAAAARAEAAEARNAARQGLSEANRGEPEPTRDLAGEVDQELEAAEEDPAESEEATDRALEALRRGIEETKFLGQALGASQAQNARRSERIREGLGRLPQIPEGGTEEAREKLEEARESMEQASRAAAEEEPKNASAAARSAEEALRQALESLAAARARASQGGAEETEELASEQEQLAEDVEELEELTEQASMNEEAEAAVREALKEASEAMRGASQKMSQGKKGAAAAEQRAASEALSRAAREARDGVTPESSEDRARAEDLAREQERIERELFEFMKRYEEREEAPPLDSVPRAQEAIEQAQEALEEGDLGAAREAEEEAQKELEKALSDLRDEEEQYQQLRDEELLFRIAEEVATLLEKHEAVSAETREVDSGRTPDSSASRGQKLRLRKIAREEAALADRSAEIGKAISAEGSVVFAELINEIEHDLDLIAESLGDRGGYRSGDRVQALQADVSNSLHWLGEALQEEMERREDEEQEKQDNEGEEQPQPEGENRLVPDVAELKLLARMERELLDNIDEILVLYPELKQAKDVDPLLLEEIQRVAHRHQRTTELFRVFRERLDIPAPGIERNDRGESEAGEERTEGEEESGE